MSKEISLKDLSAAELTKLKKELMQEQKQKESIITEQRKGYKDKVNKVIPGLFQGLQQVSAVLAQIKKRVYDEVQELVRLKSEVYDRDQDQGSHSFTTDDGITITIGYRQLDGYDDTVDVGIQKVHDYLKGLGKDANSKRLVGAIMKLLAKDAAGSLKASRVLQLKKMAEEIADPKLLDALSIIQDAYRPTRTKQFISCRYKSENGEVNELPLNITDVEMIAQAVNGVQHESGTNDQKRTTKRTKSAAK
jgi:hypothetical protein